MIAGTAGGFLDDTRPCRRYWGSSRLCHPQRHLRSHADERGYASLLASPPSVVGQHRIRRGVCASASPIHPVKPDLRVIGPRHPHFAAGDRRDCASSACILIPRGASDRSGRLIELRVRHGLKDELYDHRHSDYTADSSALAQLIAAMARWRPPGTRAGRRRQSGRRRGPCELSTAVACRWVTLALAMLQYD